MFNSDWLRKEGCSYRRDGCDVDVIMTSRLQGN